MMRKKNIFIGFMIICLLVSPMAIAPASATDWPMFQNNLNHTGYLNETSDFNPRNMDISSSRNPNLPCNFR